jgi:predicted amidophosphoribosyltransferase
MGSAENVEEKEKETPFSKMMGAWTGFIIVTLIMIVLFRAAWWIIFPIIGTLSGAVKETQKYFASKVKCPNCGADLAFDTRFCSHCGVTIPNECPSCLNPLKAGLKYCAKCGAALFSSIGQPISLASPHHMSSQEAGISQMFCSSCGSQILPEQANCPTCGASKN